MSTCSQLILCHKDMHSSWCSGRQFMGSIILSFSEGEDFEFSSVPSVINIESGTNRGCLTITIISSPVIEGREEINLAINTTTTMAAVVGGTTTVVIRGNAHTHTHMIHAL